jgi:hypothetical protein
MKSFNQIFNRFHRFQKIMVVIMIGSLGFLGACSSDDDDAGIVDTSGVTAFTFDENNTRIAAEIAAAAMEFFPAFNEISMAMLEILAGETYPPTSPFVLPLCTNTGIGSASLSWVDADGSGDLTVGDTAMLDFTTCDVDSSGETIDGPVNFEAVSVTLPTSVGINVSLDLDIVFAGETTEVNGAFGFTVETIDSMNFTNVYTALDVPGQTITITENGVPYFKAGCFNVTQTYYILDVQFGMYNLATKGVINASNQILSLAQGPAVEFMGGDMYTGTQRLLSVSEPICASIGVPANGVSSDNSYMDMEAPGGGLLFLHTFRADGTEFYTEETTWSALTD